MLSRTAEMFFWIGRYIERTEYTARLADVHYDLHLESADLKETAVDWERYLDDRGDLAAYRALYEQIETDNVLDFLVLSKQNPNSLANLVQMARENARGIQDQLSIEAWHHLNSFHLNLKSRTLHELKANPHYLLNHIKSECYTLAGVFRSTLLRGEGWTFFRLGKNIERAGQTARLLIHPVLLTASPSPRNLSDYQQCIALLKSASAHQSYRKVYSGKLSPKKIVQFLLFHDRFPRSVRFSVGVIQQQLRALSGPAQNPKRRESERLSGQLVADLKFSSIEEIYQIGLSSFIPEAIDCLDHISSGLAEIFFGATVYADQPTPRFQRKRRRREIPESHVRAIKAILSARHRFTYTYEAPVAQVQTLMRLAPPQHYGRQRRLDIRWHMEPQADYRHFTDAFGNLVWQLDHKDIKEMTCTVEMRIETQALYGIDQSLTYQGITPQESDCTVDAVEFKKLTDLVDHSEILDQWAAHLKKRGISSAEMAETILHQVGAHMRYESGQTHVGTKSSEAFKLGKGVCQDYAHIMLSLCRQAGLSARYVSGYLPGEGQSHAWVEVLLPVGPEQNPTWVAYDPTHQRRCDERYITVGIGRDYQDVAPTSGFYSGEAGSKLDAEVSVVIESQGPSDRLLPSPSLGERTTLRDIEAQQQ
ncbi:MAG: alpha-E domain-containing protein [Nitrospiria bacterium]